jgi:hypothetical protein
VRRDEKRRTGSNMYSGMKKWDAGCGYFRVFVCDSFAAVRAATHIKNAPARTERLVPPPGGESKGDQKSRTVLMSTNPNSHKFISDRRSALQMHTTLPLPSTPIAVHSNMHSQSQGNLRKKPSDCSDSRSRLEYDHAKDNQVMQLTRYTQFKSQRLMVADRRLYQ